MDWSQLGPAALTVAGAGLAGLFIKFIVDILQAAVPQLVKQVSGALAALIVSALFYVLLFVAYGVRDGNGIVQAVIAWLVASGVAIGVDQVVSQGALSNGPAAPGGNQAPVPPPNVPTP